MSTATKAPKKKRLKPRSAGRTLAPKDSQSLATGRGGTRGGLGALRRGPEPKPSPSLSIKLRRGPVENREDNEAIGPDGVAALFVRTYGSLRAATRD